MDYNIACDRFLLEMTTFFSERYVVNSALVSMWDKKKLFEGYIGNVCIIPYSILDFVASGSLLSCFLFQRQG